LRSPILMPACPADPLLHNDTSASGLRHE